MCDLEQVEAPSRAPTVDELPADVLAIACDDDASNWLRCNLFEAITRRDPLDALHDAQALTTALQSWAQHVFRLHGVELPI